jgi:hypothetical protein
MALRGPTVRRRWVWCRKRSVVCNFGRKYPSRDGLARILSRCCDKYSVSLFADHMQQLLDAAQSAASRGEACSAMTILIGQDNGIHMIADSDWPLESLALDRGAKSAYRVTGGCDATVRVEGREGLRRCVMETANPRSTARLLLGA